MNIVQLSYGNNVINMGIRRTIEPEITNMHLEGSSTNNM